MDTLVAALLPGESPPLSLLTVGLRAESLTRPATRGGRPAEPRGKSCTATPVGHAGRCPLTGAGSAYGDLPGAPRAHCARPVVGFGSVGADDQGDSGAPRPPTGAKRSTNGHTAWAVFCAPSPARGLSDVRVRAVVRRGERGCGRAARWAARPRRCAIRASGAGCRRRSQRRACARPAGPWPYRDATRQRDLCQRVDGNHPRVTRGRGVRRSGRRSRGRGPGRGW